MQFEIVEPNENLDLWAMRSESGRFEIGVRRVIFGMRVNLSYPANMTYEIDYCAGKKTLWALFIMQTIRRRLLTVDENEDLRIIRAMFPTQYHRPIDNDPKCLAHLLAIGLDADLPFPPSLPIGAVETVRARFDLKSEEINRLFAES